MQNRYWIALLAMTGMLFAADITFQVDATANPDAYSGFGLKGSWDADGNYDSGWGGGMEHAAFTDADSDDIWEVTVALVSDGGTNTWSWGIQDENDEWIQGGSDFTVPDDNPQTLTTSIAPPGDINVTFRVNSSTVQGIVDSTSGVDLRGTVTQWGPGTNLTSVGGDYWELILQLATGDYEYKYGAQILNQDGTTTDYWENDIPGADYQGGNRTLTVGTEDMVIDLDYLGSGPDNNVPPYSPSDSVDVFFRVNMGEFADFDPDVHEPSIVGHVSEWFPGAYPLTREGTSDYWNVHLKFSQAYMATTDTLLIDPAWSEDEYGMHMYRFCYDGYGHDFWGNTENLGGAYFPDNENRTIYFHSTMGDTTAQWVYWNDQGPAEFESDAVLEPMSFETDLSNAVSNNGFVLGDTLVVKYGYGGSAPTVQVDTLEQVPFSYTYSLTLDSLPVDLMVGMFYQYYRIKGGTEYREIYFNFDYTGDDVSLNERRYHDLSGAVNGSAFSIFDNVDSNVDPRRMPIFRNTDPLGQELTVTYTVDLRPAYYQVLSGDTLFDIQGVTDVTDPDSVLVWGPWMNGPATEPLTGESWTTWGGTLYGTVEKQMHDDGSTGGDAVVGDSVYSLQVTYDATETIGQEFKFGLRGGDNESGFGLNHIENIDVANPMVASYWGSINPLFYDAWDFDTNTPILTVDEVVAATPRRFTLGDNYPNPFNPVTTVEFSIPIGAEVTLSIYNLLGQKIATVHNGYAKPGTYRATWNGLDMYGSPVSSGVYLYELDAGSFFHQVKKMTLLK